MTGHSLQRMDRVNVHVGHTRQVGSQAVKPGFHQVQYERRRGSGDTLDQRPVPVWQRAVVQAVLPKLGLFLTGLNEATTSDRRDKWAGVFRSCERSFFPPRQRTRPAARGRRRPSNFLNRLEPRAGRTYSKSEHAPTEVRAYLVGFDPVPPARTDGRSASHRSGDAPAGSVVYV
jgi:hypothetical protein